MLQKYATTIETLANISIVIVAILGATVLTKQLVPRHASPIAAAVRTPAAQPREPIAGSRMSLPGVDWTERDQTLVFVLSTSCHFCTDSAPFYQRVVRESQRTGKTRLVAVLPQPTPDAVRYLKDVGVRIEKVLQAPLGSVGAPGTPTLILVDKAGTVKQTWIGRLPPERESEVLGHF